MVMLSVPLGAQLITTNNQSPQSLVQNVLTGPGVTVSNVNYQGAAIAIGTFNSTNANVGINSGVIITTGTVQNNGQGPHGPNNIGNAGMDNLAGSSPLLETQIPGSTGTFNAATLSFDFVPYSDSVKFSYVFGSEEYHEFVDSDFNDIFAFFISGPGIVGMQNMAIVPGTQDCHQLY